MVGKVVEIDFATSSIGVVSQRDQTSAEANSNADDVRNTLKIIKRNERNELLNKTDWMALSDVTMSDAWKTYRQALRDLPATSGFPNVDFPTKPE